MNIGDRVVVVKSGANGDSGVIVSRPSNGDDWNVRIDQGHFAGYTMSFKAGSLRWEDTAENVEKWWEDERFLDSMVTGWMLGLTHALDGIANSIDRLAKAQEESNRLR